ncbi:FAD-dependent monooxygenase [Bradyrhizobium diazoefficiens]|nr:FAD-dependent monooxygenase [Bradyrhizobium diazoefficiens]MBR0775177.1 FAD-dependent monooxygenase [Bradyrhizobium diazoefficiens]
MNVDVCVIGGGPSGAIAAIELARRGFRVGLLHHPDTRARWPETISPRLPALLAQIGLADVVSQALCARMEQAPVNWIGACDDARAPSDALILDRARFDELLRARAEHAGVEIRQCRAGRPVMGLAGVWNIPVEEGGVVRARFVVIAAGRRALPRIRGGRRMVAYYGIASNVSVASPGVLAGRTRHGRYWGASLRDGALRMLVFRESCKPSKPAPMVLLREALRCAAPGEGCTSLAFVRATDATARSCATAVGANWIRTGDALLTVDPRSGAGLYAAVLSAVQAARVVDTIMWRPDQAAAAMSFYAAVQSDIRRHCDGMVSPFHDAALRTAAGDAPKDRPAVDYARLYLSPELRLAPVPLVEDYVGERLGIVSEARCPVTAVEGQPFAALLAPLVAGKSLLKAAGSWPRLSLQSRAALMHLLMEERIVVPAGGALGRVRRTAAVTGGLVSNPAADRGEA